MTIINKLIPPLPPTYQVQSLEQAQQVIQLPSAESSCRNYIAYYQSYCSQHANACRESYCSSRIASGQSYCNQHQYSYCNSCSTTIPKGNVYCNSHLNTCLTCSTRIAGGSSYCSNCTRQNSEQTKLQELVKQRTSISGVIKEVTRFEVPTWSNNLATAK